MFRHVYVTGEGDLLAVAENMEGSRVFVAWEPEQALRWWQALDNDLLPTDTDDGIGITDEGITHLIGTARPGDLGELEAIYADGATGDLHEDDEGPEVIPLGYRLGPKGRRLILCSHPTKGFREFLRVWNFLDQDTGQVRLLGEVLWVGQEHYVEVCATNLWVYYLKARQLGETTIAIAYDAWVMRFRTKNARVHLVSRTEELAKRSLLRPVKKGLEALPTEMQLPVLQQTTTNLILDAGPDDTRSAFAYAAKEPGRGETCSHLHLDEWAAMAETAPDLPKDVWAAAEPTISKQGGTVHILTTGVGPEGYYADVWRLCVEGEGQLHAAFIRASGSRPEYTDEFLRHKKATLADDARFAHEYPETWEDALAGAGETYFKTFFLDHAAEYARGYAPPGSYIDRRGRTRKRRYVKAWDIGGDGERSDACVGLVLDVSEGVWDVVQVIHNRGEEYPVTAWRVAELHRVFPGPTVIENNNAGGAVIGFLKKDGGVPEHELISHNTSRQSKPVALAETKLSLEQMTLKWNPRECPILDQEMRSYKLDDKAIKQDTVMALSIAVHYGVEAAADTGGRIVPMQGGYSI